MPCLFAGRRRRRGAHSSRGAGCICTRAARGAAWPALHLGAAGAEGAPPLRIGAGERSGGVVHVVQRGGAGRAGAKEYSTAVDLWSLGCIMAELLTKEVLFDGRGELDQLQRIFSLLGSPSEKIWPGLGKLPNVSKVRKPRPTPHPPPPPPPPRLLTRSTPSRC